MMTFMGVFKNPSSFCVLREFSCSWNDSLACTNNISSDCIKLIPLIHLNVTVFVAFHPAYLLANALGVTMLQV
jgi:hypothetical protein